MANTVKAREKIFKKKQRKKAREKIFKKEQMHETTMQGKKVLLQDFRMWTSVYAFMNF